MIPIVIMAIEDESDRDYITGLFLKNERSMYAMALKIVKEHHTACDMVSEACLKMIEKIGYLREISVQKQTPYILSIVKNTSLMYLRQLRSCICVSGAVRTTDLWTMNEFWTIALELWRTRRPRRLRNFKSTILQRRSSASTKSFSA